MRGKSNLGNVNVTLVFKGIFEGSLKTTLQNKNNRQGFKNTLKDSLGFWRNSGKEKAHTHKQIFPVTARAGGDRWPGVKSLCAVCGTQGT